MQRLILPINDAKLTASWKTDAYKNRFGFVHYGIDLVSTVGNTTVYAMGECIVLGAGYDNVFGNSIVIKYPEVYNHKTQTYHDLIVRYNHFASINVKKGEEIKNNSAGVIEKVIGQYGATGQYVSGAHLHLEVDTDTQWPFFTPSLSVQSTLFKGTKFNANDKTMSNPLDWIYCKADAPDKQTWTTANDVYIRSEDKTIQMIT